MSIGNIKKIVDFLEEKAEGVSPALDKEEEDKLKRGVMSSQFKVYRFKKVVDYKNFKELKEGLDLSWRGGHCYTFLHTYKNKIYVYGWSPNKSDMRKDDLKTWYIAVDTNYVNNLKKYEDREKNITFVENLPFRCTEYLNLKSSYKTTRQRELNRFYELTFLKKRRAKYEELEQAYRLKENKRLVAYENDFIEENQARFLKAKNIILDCFLISEKDKALLSECSNFLDFRKKVYKMRYITEAMLERAANEKFTEYKFNYGHFNKNYSLWCK